MKIRYYDAHMHMFTLDHVPEYFFTTLPAGQSFLKISLLQFNFFSRKLAWLITRNATIALFKWFAPETAKQLKRLRGLFAYKDIQTQEELLLLEDKVNKQYIRNAEFSYIVLTMDMEYMGAGKPRKNYIEQLIDAEVLKYNSDYNQRIHIFAHTDPRRIEENPELWEMIKAKLLDKTYAGIKLYPALGYYPFDKRLRPVYEFAIENKIPIMTHVIKGSVYYRDKKNIKIAPHPITGNAFYGKDLEDYQLNYSHPLNYECLMNQNFLKRYWGEDAPDLSSLRICLAHFGGEDEWVARLETPATPNPLDITNEWFKKNRHSWVEVVKAMILKYDNIYTDISYILYNDKSIIPKLRSSIAQTPKLNTRVLYGTDYYVVASDEEFDKTIHDLDFTLPEWEQLAYQNVHNAYLDGRV